MPFGIPKGAMCVQRFDDSLNSAIHTTYRISLRSSSMPEPRDPLLKVLMLFACTLRKQCIAMKLYKRGPSTGKPAEETNAKVLMDREEGVEIHNKQPTVPLDSKFYRKIVHSVSMVY
jgi:hypothetical protein